MLTKEHKLHWDVAKRRFAWESREQHPSRAWCVPQQTPALLAVWSIATMGDAGTIWPVLLPSWQKEVWERWLGLLVDHELLHCMLWLA